MELVIENIQKSYRSARVLDGVSLTARSGEQIGILGQNGCGKSTLLSILAGILKSDAGRFLVTGKTPDGRSAQMQSKSPANTLLQSAESGITDTSVSVDLLKNAAARSRLIGYVPQSTPLLEELTAYDNLRLWYTGGKRLLERELEHGALRDLGISSFLHKRVSRLSGGMKKRLSIGCALAHHPRILLLDEPGAALDLLCKQSIVDYLQGFCRAGGIVLIASHEIPEIASCTRTFTLRDGVLHPFRYTGDVAQLVEQL